MQPKVIAVLVALLLLSAPLAVLAARLVRDLRRARRPLPASPRLARLALALNAEFAATPAQWRLARLRRGLFESCTAAHRMVRARDDPHAGWLLGEALRLARRLDDELRELWLVADVSPALLERAANRVDAVDGALGRLCEAVSIRAVQGGDERLAELVAGVESEHAARLRAGGILHRGGGRSSPGRNSPGWPAPEGGHMLTSGASAPRGERWQGTSTATITAWSESSGGSPAASDPA